MKEETFAEYILDEEKSIEEKIEIMCYLEKKYRHNPNTYIFFDKSIIFKTYITKIFIEIMNLDVDKNMVLTACLLCNCKKGEEPQTEDRVKVYAKEGAEHLNTLGFSKQFCKICEEVNRYSNSNPREKESDILEIVDQFGGMLIDRAERKSFTPEEALLQLEYRNLKDVFNRYLGSFREFIEKTKDIEISINDNSMKVNFWGKIQREVNKVTV